VQQQLHLTTKKGRNLVMPTYTATFRTAAEYAVREFTADTPEQALQAARELGEHAVELLTFESYDMMMPLDEIEISSDEANRLAVWRSEDIRLATADLLDAAQAALNYLTDHAIDLEGEPEELLAGIRVDLADAIAKAKGDAP
jgi:hypothetical protein